MLFDNTNTSSESCNSKLEIIYFDKNELDKISLTIAFGCKMSFARRTALRLLSRDFASLAHFLPCQNGLEWKTNLEREESCKQICLPLNLSFEIELQWWPKNVKRLCYLEYVLRFFGHHYSFFYSNPNLKLL